MSDEITVFIADDQTLLRESFAVLIDTEDDMRVVGEAGDGRRTVEEVTRSRPDVVLMDVRMPDMDGITATREICASGDIGTRVLMLTTFDLDEYVYSSIRAGASGFLLKDAPTAQLLHAIRVVHSGQSLLAPTVTRRLIGEFAARAHQPAPRELPEITEREREVLTLVARGLTNSEIAAHMYLSLATVKTHVSHLLRKLSCRDRAQLVIRAYESRLIIPGG